MSNGIECFNKEKIDKLKESLTSYEDDAKVYKALANEGRLKVLHLLAQENCCVCDLSQAMDSPVPTISQYLRILKHAKLVQSTKEGKFIIYALTPQAQQLGIFK